MNYYYDLILNFSLENILFYEWDDTDNLEYIEKIPLFKIIEKDMSKILENNIKINQDFLLLIKDKTTIKSRGIINTINYACIFTDAKSAIAIEFNDKGEVIGRSNLLLEDDLNVIEMAFTLKKKEISYEILNKIEVNTTLREITKMKSFIKNEIVKLYEEKNKDKLSFLFLEWFGINDNNLKNIYQTMLAELENELDDKQCKVYEIIKLSYSKI